MVAERLARHHTPVTTVHEYRVEAAWSSVPVHAIQFLFDPMSRSPVVALTSKCIIIAFSTLLMYKGGAINIVIEKGGASIESLRSTAVTDRLSKLTTVPIDGVAIFHPY
ncbi:hypothetical protein TNCV_4386901 [Trichonephila clavipes]|nr:hypothetical protein TNCV_4386901 [Trichonephila clavipes]